MTGVFRADFVPTGELAAEMLLRCIRNRWKVKKEKF